MFLVWQILLLGHGGLGGTDPLPIELDGRAAVLCKEGPQDSVASSSSRLTTWTDAKLKTSPLYNVR